MAMEFIPNSPSPPSGMICSLRSAINSIVAWLDAYAALLKSEGNAIYDLFVRRLCYCVVMRRISLLSVPLCLAASVFGASFPSTQLRGEYIEARTADVYTGPCFANSE